MVRQHCLRRAGFTLLELLVVIAIVSLIIALVIPAVNFSRESARRANCANNERQFGVALHGYEAAHDAFPSSVTIVIKATNATNPQMWMYNYVAALLPYIGENALGINYRHHAMFCAPENATAIITPLSIGTCPSAPDRDTLSTGNFVPSAFFPAGIRRDPNFGPFLEQADHKYSTTFRGCVTDYRPAAGADSPLPSPFAHIDSATIRAKSAALARERTVVLERHTTSADLINGLSHTVMLTETGSTDPPAWADPRLATWASSSQRSFHATGANTLFADGHVEYSALSN